MTTRSGGHRFSGSRMSLYERLILALVAIVSMVAGLALYYGHNADERSQRNAAGKQAAVQALGTANTSLARNGLSPVPTPTVAGPAPTVTVTKNIAGPAGPGPSQAQIAVAVAAYCSTAQCGSGPTAAQVAQAVATFCGRNGECRGPSGQSVTGPAGPAGATVTGPPGQNATADQVASAVATYCDAHNQCAGPAGQDATGAPGADGQPPLSWTYTDALSIEHTCRRTEDFNPGAPTYTCN